MRIRWGRVLVAFFILELIICGIIYMIIDFKTKQEINIIKNSYKAHTSEIMLDEINNIQNEIMSVYEPKNEVKNDVELIAEEIGIEYELLEAIIRHETGHRTSRAFKELNNPCGMMFWNGNKMELREYETVEDGYYSCGNNLKNNYIDKGLTTIEQIQPKYAPIGINDNGLNQYWVSGVTKIYNDLKGE